MNSSLLVIGEIDLESELFGLAKGILIGTRQGGNRHLAVQVAVDH